MPLVGSNNCFFDMLGEQLYHAVPVKQILFALSDNQFFRLRRCRKNFKIFNPS